MAWALAICVCYLQLESTCKDNPAGTTFLSMYVKLQWYDARETAYWSRGGGAVAAHAFQLSCKGPRLSNGLGLLLLKLHDLHAIVLQGLRTPNVIWAPDITPEMLSLSQGICQGAAHLPDCCSNRQDSLVRLSCKGPHLGDYLSPAQAAQSVRY